ncbi:2, 3 cyclic phosphodiesterase [Clathrospora elynae]|uniref:2, 3 cyclic phosphodiesterase n=1 Tax=Clathrospora elynae TaxID=706981 RepID=A0A6A5T5Y9_9PLEO|nr:2, 3 cyclic phosphodiesterase [Clathrospora elynae]
MPGSSLWLLPPATQPLNPLLISLIDKTSTHFASPHRFLPHITLTSEISASTYSSTPQKWLDSLDLPTGADIQVKFKRLGSSDVFFRKLYITCEKSSGLKTLARRCRQQVAGFGEEEKAQVWVEDKYMPHLSLLYHDCPPVDAKGLVEVEQLGDELGVSIEGKGDLDGWVGGRVILVPTDRSIDQWTPIVERTLT